MHGDCNYTINFNILSQQDCNPSKLYSTCGLVKDMFDVRIVIVHPWYKETRSTTCSPGFCSSTIVVGLKIRLD